MSDPLRAWDGEQVRRWLERRREASRLDQAVADRRGYDARDEYDKAAAEEWACRELLTGDYTREQAAFSKRVKELIGWDDYPATGIHDDARFERHVRGQLRKVAKMTKANEGFEKMLRYQ
jgi:hypothetical protein